MKKVNFKCKKVQALKLELKEYIDITGRRLNTNAVHVLTSWMTDKWNPQKYGYVSEGGFGFGVGCDLYNICSKHFPKD